MPTIHLRNPNKPLPGPNDYRNPSFYTFIPHQASTSAAQDGISRTRSLRSGRTDKSTRSKKATKAKEDKEPVFRKAFDKFHSENGVRTVTGSIGPVGNVRMLLKNGYRHVYMSRKFAVKHGFVPKDASLGYYGYGGLVKYIKPLRLSESHTLTQTAALGLGRLGYTSSTTKANANCLRCQLPTPSSSRKNTTSTSFWVDRSWRNDRCDQSAPCCFAVLMDLVQVKINPLDPTDVQCLDTRETVDCEVVILKDGRGQIVTVT